MDPHVIPRIMPAAAFAVGALIGAWLNSVLFHNERMCSAKTTTNETDVSTAPSPLSIATVLAVSDPLSEAEPPYLREEQLSRSRAFFAAITGRGKSSRSTSGPIAGIETAFVVVVGVGGVGSHAAAALARSGVARLRLIDYDFVSLSSLNRHATACRSDVGTPKTLALASALKRIVPWCEIECVQRVFNANAAAELLAGSPDYILDCIDDVDTKAALLVACAQRGLRVVSSLGAGGRADPTRIHVGDLGDVTADPLATALRKALRVSQRSLPAAGRSAVAPSAAESDSVGDEDSSSADVDDTALPPRIAAAIPTGITCVFSSEPTRAGLLPLPLDKAAGDSPSDFGAAEGFRVRVVPVVGMLPSAFGCAMAAHVLCSLAGAAVEPVPCAPQSGASRKALRNLIVTTPARYDAFAPHVADEPPPTLDEAAFVVDSLWRQRSSASCTRATARGAPLRFARWRPNLPSSPTNLVLVTAAEASALDAATTAALRCAHGDKGAEKVLHAQAVTALFGSDVVARIEARLDWARSQGWV